MSLLKKILAVSIIILITGCSGAPKKNPYLYDAEGNRMPRSERTLNCIERLLVKDVTADNASNICNRLFMRRK
jgi:hypothetical protein